MNDTPSRLLNDGNSIPALGFGTNQMGQDAIASAIDTGYRLLDTAFVYGNEAELGRAVRESSVPREQLTIATKLPGRFHGFDEAREALSTSLEAMQLESVDLFMIHWPMPRLDKFVDTWRGLIALRDEGLTRSIGVCNFTPAHLSRLIDETGVVPAVNQVELHPHFPQAELRAFHAAHGIQTMSWSPLGRRAELMATAEVQQIAAAHGVSPAQAVLRWHLELGSIPIPRSTNPERQLENLDVFGFELTPEEVERLSALEAGRLWGGDPDTKEEF